MVFLEVNGFNYLLTKFNARWPISRVLCQFDDDHSSRSMITIESSDLPRWQNAEDIFPSLFGLGFCGLHRQ